MNKIIRRAIQWNAVIVILFAMALSGCPLTVNLNVSTDKPIPIYLVIDKPIPVKLDADVAVAKLPLVNIVTDQPIAVKLDGDVAVTNLPPVILGF
ncbi:hypothetical protein [Thiocystis violacea]|uniref:hypothetical protein n=1 Tax=Thiocystis violacea TaxID=13725 RepID=UPI001907E87E|nr:hypothetical protein [Thiocystis violacea]MBK1717015.1 hypothetical protein [Thiocystis violacea]